MTGCLTDGGDSPRPGGCRWPWWSGCWGCIASAMHPRSAKASNHNRFCLFIGPNFGNDLTGREIPDAKAERPGWWNVHPFSPRAEAQRCAHMWDRFQNWQRRHRQRDESSQSGGPERQDRASVYGSWHSRPFIPTIQIPEKLEHKMPVPFKSSAFAENPARPCGT
jgi:hypothetical protein